MKRLCAWLQEGSLLSKESRVRSERAIFPDLRQMEKNLTHEVISSC